MILDIAIGIVVGVILLYALGFVLVALVHLMSWLEQL